MGHALYTLADIEFNHVAMEHFSTGFFILVKIIFQSRPNGCYVIRVNSC
uniref:Hypotheticial protein n=1 Tax=Schistosoma japonicum TaxID=6182 RepID=C7TXW1_SCHJA|nr:hypotheticial protein [Schistosoma japonicum]